MSSKPPRDRFYLQHILDAILRIESYMEGINRQKFDETLLVQDAVIRQLEIIGEASKRLTPEFKEILSSVPWRQIAGMRDKLTHDYMGVDLDAVWQTATQDLGAAQEGSPGSADARRRGVKRRLTNGWRLRGLRPLRRSHRDGVETVGLCTPNSKTGHAKALAGTAERDHVRGSVDSPPQ